MSHLVHPASEIYMFDLSGHTLTWFIFGAGLVLFFYILYRRYRCLRVGLPDPRFKALGERVWGLIVYGFIQLRQPRYLWAGVIHIFIFWGFMVLGLRSVELLTQGLGLPFLDPLMQSGFGRFYDILKDIFEIVVLVTCVAAILRRVVGNHPRYEGSHQVEAYLILGLIAFLMLTDMSFEGSKMLLEGDRSSRLPAAGLAAYTMEGLHLRVLQDFYRWSYWLHVLTFFFFLNLLPLSKHFHIITALPNIFLRNLDKGSIKPARWGVEDIEDLETLGAGNMEDFSWKHILDFFTCTECGRCTDQCPATAVGRPLSPKLLTMKLRDHAYKQVPVFNPPGRAVAGPSAGESQGAEGDESMIGEIVGTEELWSCTTCGACEEECPVFIEYIDKIIDMRRHLIESARSPGSFNQVLVNVEKTGNPFGKPPGKRAEWLSEVTDVPVRSVEAGDDVDLLYFVDSYGSYDPRVQAIAGAIVRAFQTAGVDFGILGALEKDSGHQVRRIGEEGLFQLLLEENMETLKSVNLGRIVTTDPHAFNTLKNDYPLDVEVLHYSQVLLELIEGGKLRPGKLPEGSRKVTYHDPCYLGRHNGVYRAPRKVLQQIPGVRLVEMERSGQRSFCCGGADIILWYEIEEEQIRMAEKRIMMAREVDADLIVTACPFCLIHFEDAIKTAGLEDELQVVDLMELFMSTLQPA